MEFLSNGMLTEWLEQYPNGECHMAEAEIAFVCREVSNQPIDDRSLTSAESPS